MLAVLADARARPAAVGATAAQGARPREVVLGVRRGGMLASQELHQHHHQQRRCAAAAAAPPHCRAPARSASSSITTAGKRCGEKQQRRCGSQGLARRSCISLSCNNSGMGTVECSSRRVQGPLVHGLQHRQMHEAPCIRGTWGALSHRGRAHLELGGELRKGRARVGVLVPAPPHHVHPARRGLGAGAVSVPVRAACTAAPPTATARLERLGIAMTVSGWPQAETTAALLLISVPKPQQEGHTCLAGAAGRRGTR